MSDARRRSPWPGTFAALFFVVSAVGCHLWAERRLVGQWKTEVTPERTLDLFADGSYALRLSGKGLGFLSDLAGPEKGTWRVERGSLVLSHTVDTGVENVRKLKIDEIHGDDVVLGGDRWRRVPR